MYFFAKKIPVILMNIIHLPLLTNHTNLPNSLLVGTSASVSCGSMNLFPDDHRSVYSMGRTVSRLRDFDDFSMDSPYSGRRPSSHTAFVPQPSSPGSMDSSPRRLVYGLQHLPNFHHDHLHHQEQDQLGINTLQPNSQRRERAREALLRRNLCDFNVSLESGATNSVSSRTGTTELRTDPTVVPNFSGRMDHQGKNQSQSNTSLHSNQSAKSEDPDSIDHLSSEDNLSHESYDLLDKEEEAQINSFSENMKTVLSRSELSFDNSVSYSQPLSMPPTPNRVENLDGNFVLDNDPGQSTRDDVNSNVKNKINNHSSTHSSRLSINSSGMSTSPVPDSVNLQKPVSTLSRRRSSGSGSQKSKSSKGSKSGSGSRISLKDEQQENQNCFQGHEVHQEDNISSTSNIQFFPKNKSKQELNRNGGKVRDDSRDSGMHESLIFQSPTNLKYFSSHISPQPYSSRTLPGKKRREKSPIIFTRGKLSVDCSSNSSSSHASPRISRPKSLDFSVIALTDLPRKNAYSYRDDTIDQHDFEDSSSALSAQNELNYASSSDVPPTPENPELPMISATRSFNSSLKTNQPCNYKQVEERIYDIPEGIERELRSHSPISETYSKKPFPPKYYMDQTKFKTYLEISGKFSSEDSESVSNRQSFKVLPPPRVINKVSSTESESAPSNHSVPAAVHFDSDTLSLPLDLLSPPMESESSGALVESESLPAPPQFGSNKDDTDIEDDVTPKGEDLTPDSLDLYNDTNTIKKNKHSSLPQANVRQESTYETRAEAALESQLTTESFQGDLEPQPDILDSVSEIDSRPNLGKRRESALLRALDTFDSFNLEHEFPVTRRQESTYEDRAEAMLEKQTTVDSFTSQNSIDDNVFLDYPGPPNPQEICPVNTRETVLESQSTFESFTTECEVLITKKEESTYEERAEALLESQNTIESFTTEVPNDENVFREEYDFNESFDSSGRLLQHFQSSDAKEVLIADMYVKKVGSNESVSTNGESEFDTVPFQEDGVNVDLNECTCNDSYCFRNIVPPPLQNPVFIPSSRSSSGSSFDCPLNLELSTDADTPVRDLSNSCLDFPTGPYDIVDPQHSYPEEDFGSYILQKPVGFRDGFLGPFHQRTLSRISEKSSNESGSPQSDGPPQPYADNTSVSDHEEQNYTTSEDNENAPSISSDLPENMGPHLELQPNPSFDDVQVEYNMSPPSSNIESPKITEFTQIDQDTLEEDLDDTNAEEIKTEERNSPIEIHPEISNSISSENNNTNRDLDGSLHDSMEILEDVNTIDYFDNEEKQFYDENVPDVRIPENVKENDGELSGLFQIKPDDFESGTCNTGQEDMHSGSSKTRPEDCVSDSYHTRAEEPETESYQTRPDDDESGSLPIRLEDIVSESCLPKPENVESRLEGNYQTRPRDISDHSGRYVVKEGSEELMF